MTGKPRGPGGSRRPFFLVIDGEAIRRRYMKDQRAARNRDIMARVKGDIIGGWGVAKMRNFHGFYSQRV